MTQRCVSANGRSVSLPVLDGAARMRATRIGPWRAGVLIAVHVLMAVHIVQWLIMGSTLTPIEPSESMQALELGVINAGAIFFGVALLATLVFGRYVCGWLCHVIALQDFCAWLMNRAGVRPKPFRSRLLVFVPLILGSYMFLWPSFKRLVLQPFKEWAGIEWPWWLRRVEPLYGVRAELMTEDFWSTFPEWYIAIPFLLVCGFATVYFLGSKAFCTYACPYGGMFGLIEPAAPVRVRVDHDKCKGCGHCTAACTSNVRVHEEIKIYGMVVDPGCMKTMDCISVCPNDALSIAPGRPAIAVRARPGTEADRAAASSKRARRYDLTWPGEIGAAVVFFVLFVATRGMFDRVPMLMAGGLAAVGTGLSVLLWKVLRGPNARLHRLELRMKGKLRPAGLVFIALMLAGWTLAAWGGAGNFTRWRGQTLHAGVGVPIDAIMRPEFAPGPATQKRARAGLIWYDLARAPGEGGLGWNLKPDDEVRVAYLHAVLGEYDRGVVALRRVVEQGRPTDSLIFQLLALHSKAATLAAERGDRFAVAVAAAGEQEEILRDTLARHPHLHGVRLRLAQMMEGLGRSEPELWEVDDPKLTGDPNFFLKQGQVHAMRGDREMMSVMLDRVLALNPTSPAVRLEAAQLANAIGRNADAIRLVESVIDKHPDAPTLLSAARIMGNAGQGADAIALAGRAAEATGWRQPGVRFGIGQLLYASGQRERAVELMFGAADDLRHNPWQSLGVASALMQMGFENDDEGLRARGMAIFDEIRSRYPDEPLFKHDHAGWLFNSGRTDEAAEAILAAARIGADNALLADRASQLLGQLGRHEESAFWQREAEARRRGGPESP